MAKMKLVPVDTFYVYPVCDKCGGTLLPTGATIIMCMPPKREFVCAGCGEKETLPEKQWPHQQITYRTENVRDEEEQ